VLETIREATPADGAAIAAVNVVSWQVGYRGLLPEEMLAGLSVAELEQRWTAGLRAGGARVSTLVACRGDDVVGYSTVGPLRNADDGADLGEPGTDLGELRTIYVHPDHWRHGIGSRLHTAALHKLAASGFPLAVLFALVGNDRAISFYRRAGWVMDGGRKTGVGPAGVRLDEVRLHRTLP
jgi:ribosomal protein S18 acetylase RimI-like enzyme